MSEDLKHNIVKAFLWSNLIAGTLYFFKWCLQVSFVFQNPVVT